MRFADQVREAVDAPPNQSLRLSDVLRAGRFRFREADLAAPEGACEALLIPTDGDSFDIVVDARPLGGWSTPPTELRDETKRQRARFRIAHEIAHSFFYSREGGRPRRTVLAKLAGEEDFCDAFAGALLVPPAAVSRLEPTGESIFMLQRTFDVSAEVAAKALAATHPARPRVTLAYWTSSSREPIELQWSTPKPASRHAAHVCAERKQVAWVTA